MPFTFAHPAIIFPAKYLDKRWYSWTGLIIGSMVPDFEAFVNLGGDKVYSHSWVGMFTYDLPLGLLIAFIFHFFVRSALVANLPDFFQKRFCVYSQINWRKYFGKHSIVVIISMLAGIASHLALDRITHTDSYTYTQKAGLSFSPEENTMLRIWLQWGGSALGIIILIWQISVLPVLKKNGKKRWFFYWPISIVVCILLYSIRLNFRATGDDMINTAIGGWMLGVIIASLCYNLKYNAKLTG